MPAPLAVPAAEHRVARHSASYPRRIHALSGRGDDARPLVAATDRVFSLTRVQVGHLAGVELDVGAADAHPLDVDDAFVRPGFRAGDLAHLRSAGSGDDERTHRHSRGPAWIRKPAKQVTRRSGILGLMGTG